MSPHGVMLGIKSTWAEDLIAASEKSFEPNKTQTKPKSKIKSIDTAIYFRNIWALVSLCIPESMYSTSVLQWWTQKKYGNQTKQMILLQLGFYQFLAYHNILGIKRQCGMVLFGDRRQFAYEMGWSFQNY